jgi:LacI family transcriptional regulator
MDDLAMFSCQNPSCSDYGRPGAGNLSVCARYGKQQRRLLYCKTCKARFSERKGTAMFDSRLPEDKAEAILQLLAAGHGIRETARLVGVSKDTVLRYGVRARQQPPEVPDEPVTFALSPEQSWVSHSGLWLRRPKPTADDSRC